MNRWGFAVAVMSLVALGGLACKAKLGGDVNVVESYVSYLRRKIDTGDKRLLHTLRGVGYVLREPR